MTLLSRILAVTAGLSFLASAYSYQRRLPIKVFILAGQSNMEGQGMVEGKDENGKELPGTLTSMFMDPIKGPQLDHLRDQEGNWSTRNDVWVYDINEFGTHKGPLGLGFGWDLGNKDWFGPELEFGHSLKRYMPNPLLIIKTAWGGKSLYDDFRPPSSGGKVGPYYTLMLNTVNSVLANLGNEFPNLKGQPFELGGFVWWHGWNDFCGPKSAVADYKMNLVHLIQDLRHDLHAPKLPVVIGEFTGPWGADCKEPAAVAIRKAQADVANVAAFRRSVRFVETHDFVRTRAESPTREDYHEYKNGETYFLIGQALGEGMATQLGLRPITQPLERGIRDFGFKSYVRLSHRLPHVEGKPWKLVCELPYNAQFQPSCTVSCTAGKTILLNSTNPLVRYLNPTESCTTSAGVHEYIATRWVSGEGAVYTIPAGVTVNSVKYRETGVKTRIVGSFECNDEDYNILWRRAARTAYLCMRDHFYDCPDRERVGFWGDGTPELDQTFYIFDRGSRDLAKQLVLRKLEPEFYPGQHLEFLGEYGIWFYYMQTGDLDALKTIYEPTRDFLLHTYKFGNRGTWYDWGIESKDTSVLENCFMYLDLGTLRKVAILTGHSSDVAEIDERRHVIQTSFDVKFWKGGYYQSGDVTSPDDRANAMAINAGLASPDKWASIDTNVLQKVTNSSCFFDRWVFEALVKIGRTDEAMLRMATRYRSMINSPITTLWEHYDRWWASWINAFDEGSSLNHGWNPPALLLSKVVAGIQPVEPGWTKFEVKPHEAFLTSLKVSVPTDKGAVKVQIRKTRHLYKIQTNVPKATTAEIGIPQAAFEHLDELTVNGQTIWKGGIASEQSQVKFLGLRDGYLTVGVAEGDWTVFGVGAVKLDSPKAPANPAIAEKPLNKTGWTAAASVPDSTFLFSGAKIPVDGSAQNALDGDYWTGWRDMTQTQHPGQWFQVDMQREQTFNQITLDNTWALWDFPKVYRVTVSSDGSHWSDPIASGQGHLGPTNIEFPTQHARYVRITQTGSDPTYHWSIYEFNVYYRGRVLAVSRLGLPAKIH